VTSVRVTGVAFWTVLIAVAITALQPLPVEAGKINCCGGGGDTPLECTEHVEPVFQCAWQSQCTAHCCAEYCIEPV
jgi:hypothetical protein